jgi:hypothetical protein
LWRPWYASPGTTAKRFRANEIHVPGVVVRLFELMPQGKNVGPSQFSGRENKKTERMED